MTKLPTLDEIEVAKRLGQLHAKAYWQKRNRGPSPDEHAAGHAYTLLIGYTQGMSAAEVTNDYYDIRGRLVPTWRKRLKLIAESPNHAYEVEERSPKRAAIRIAARQPDGALRWYSHELTIDQAAKLNLTKSDRWKGAKGSQDMLWAKCVNSAQELYAPGIWSGADGDDEVDDHYDALPVTDDYIGEPGDADTEPEPEFSDEPEPELEPEPEVSSTEPPDPPPPDGAKSEYERLIRLLRSGADISDWSSDLVVRAFITIADHHEVPHVKVPLIMKSRDRGSALEDLLKFDEAKEMHE